MLVVCDGLDGVVEGGGVVVGMGFAEVVVVTGGGWVLDGGGGGKPGPGGGWTPLLEVVDGIVVLDGLLVEEPDVVVGPGVVVVVWPGTGGASETRSP
ncbi:hypothetical protein NLX83_02005 [Allokutzneria sp. A3M-2-11 16]|nr:hypothetical protein [Allokutzneria sp. A3M-2-11 16]